jgi:cell division protein FtsW
MATLAPYRVQRLATFVDPWPHQFDSGYQLVQSLIAFGRGEWLGLGLGRSVQKMFYLPEAHTDFVFAIVGEELGFVGALAVIALFAVLIGRMLLIGRRAERLQHKFSAYVCYGVALVFGGQTFINMGVNAGLLPTKGLTLPFFSYGGSSLLVSCVLVGLVLRVAIETDSDTEVVAKESQRLGSKTR